MLETDWQKLSDEERTKLTGQWADEDSKLTKRAPYLLAEVICPDHEYTGRISQVIGFDHQRFISNLPLNRFEVGVDYTGGIWQRAAIVKFRHEVLAVPENCYQIIDKYRISYRTPNREIEVIEGGKVGLLLAWHRSSESSGARGIYVAEIDTKMKTKEDMLMDPSPNWIFRRQKVKAVEK